LPFGTAALTSQPFYAKHVEEIMIYEMRVYRCVPGRLPALLKRFENVTLKLWDKHGIRQAGFWTTLIGDSNQELTYLLAWESLADRERKWNAFMGDPAWISARAESEKDGPILANASNQILQPTAFSAVK
jgi:NIPSNAP protein